MTTLIERIKNDQTAARIAKDAAAVSVLTPLFSEAAMVGKNAGNRPSTDDEVVATVRKFLKGVNETVAERTKRGLDVSEQEAEVAILNRYLPKQMTADEIAAEVRKFLAEKPGSAMGIVMAHLKSSFPGMYDGKVASNTVKEVLAG